MGFPIGNLVEHRTDALLLDRSPAWVVCAGPCRTYGAAWIGTAAQPGCSSRTAEMDTHGYDCSCLWWNGSVADGRIGCWIITTVITELTRRRNLLKLGQITAEADAITTSKI